MRQITFLLCLLLAGLQALWAVPASERIQVMESVSNLQLEISALEAQMAATSTACGGEAAIALLQAQIDELRQRLRIALGRDGGSLDQGGEACSDARLISSLPFCDVGNTLTSVDDFTPPTACGPSSGAPDVVYRFVPTTTMMASVSLCGSGFNTILSVWRGCPSNAASELICCNNDAPSCAPASCCPDVAFTPGAVYYIVVDGAMAAAGSYTLRVGPAGSCPMEICQACSVSCPSDGTLEPEACPPNPEVNAGCYGWPVQFTPLACGQTMCGTSSWSHSYKDYDAYSVTIGQRDSLRWCVTAEFDFEITVYQFFSAG